jgi:peptidoglycan hydrolase CwlO-like protein
MLVRPVLLVLSSLVVLPSSGLEARADTADELEAARATLRGIIERVDAASAERDALGSELVELFRRVDRSIEELESVQAGIAVARTRIQGLGEQVARTQLALDERAVDAFMIPPVRALEIVLAAGSLGDAQDAIQFLATASRSDADLLHDLARAQVELDAERSRLGRLEEQMVAVRDRLGEEASALSQKVTAQGELLDQLSRDRAEAEALVRRLTQQQPAPSSPPPTPAPPAPTSPPPKPPPSSDYTVEQVKAMIVDDFAAQGDQTVDVALCVARIESNYDPLRVNPITNASGVFQFLPSTWDALAPRAGWAGASVFDARANVGVAAWTVRNYGWSPWSTAASMCGA